MTLLRRRVQAFLASCALAVAGACSGPGQPPASSTTVAPSAAPTVVDSTTATTEETGANSTTASREPPTTTAEISIRATAGVTFASARVLTLADPVEGFTDVAFTTATRYRRAGGQPAALADITPGTVIEVRGSRSSPSTLLAREVTLL